jgi:hypothetical protein
MRIGATLQSGHVNYSGFHGEMTSAFGHAACPTYPGWFMDEELIRSCARIVTVKHFMEVGTPSTASTGV